MTTRLGIWLPWVLVVVFVLGHLPFLAPTLEDIDSVNFALGLHSFDVANHQPHPPGYPVFVFLSRLTRPVVAAVLPPDTAGASIDARTLATVGVLLGGVALVALVTVFESWESDRRRALLAAALVACAPLVWFDAGRPMSNMSGLAFVWFGQGAMLWAWRRQCQQAAFHRPLRVVASDPSDASIAMRHTQPLNAGTARWLVIAGLVVGIGAGVRSQTALSSLPLLVVVLSLPEFRRSVVSWLLVGGGVCGGLVLWAVPLFMDAGGIGAYLAAFRAQAGEDLTGVEMLATNPSLSRFALALGHTFVLPWGDWPLASLVLGLACFGVVVLAVRHPRGLLLLAASSLPYLAFHLAFHETLTTRYALPVVPALAYAAVRGVDELAPKASVVLVCLLVAASLASAVPAQWIYAHQGSPLARAVAEIEAQLDDGDPEAPRPRLGMHHAFGLALRGERVARGALDAPSGRETLQLVTHFLEEDAEPVWFLADPKRTDLERIDHAARALQSRFRWGFPTEALLGGVRPSDVDLVEIRNPRWLVGEGWALTPELAGQSAKAGRGLPHEPLVAYVRARSTAARLMIGGRNLGGPSDAPVEFAASLDGRPLATWTVSVDPGFFLKFWDLPSGALSSPSRWVPLTIAVAGPDRSPGTVRASIDQFDVQPRTSSMFGYDNGWYEPEYDPATGRRWRWSSESAALHVQTPGVGVRLRLRGTTELGAAAGAVVSLRAGSRELASVSTSGAVSFDVLVPAPVLGLAKGLIHLETTKVNIPAERGTSPDRRRLGVRVFSVEIFPLQDAS